MNKLLLATDFDGTLAATMVDSPNGMNVLKACGRTIRDIFGREGQRIYNDKLNGLQNREPGELMSLMLPEMKMDISVTDATELFVAQKLRHLIPEISREWPKLYPGVVELFAASRNGELPVDIAVVSSGHDEFINRVFEVNEIDKPSILVTSDILRQRPLPDRERYKPGPYQLADAHAQHRREHKWKDVNDEDKYINPDYGSFLGRGEDKLRMAYVGDDPKKDGGLARRARVPYVHVPFTNPGYVPNINDGQVGVKDFNELLGLLRSGFGEREGVSFSEAILKRPDSEMFPKPSAAEMPYNRMMSAYARR